MLGGLSWVESVINCSETCCTAASSSLIIPLLDLLSAKCALQPYQHASKLAIGLWLWKLSVCTFALVKVSIAAIPFQDGCS